MASIRKIKHRIDAYKSTISLLKNKIKKLETLLDEDRSKTQESMEEGEIRDIAKERRKRKIDESNCEAILSGIDSKARKSMPELLKEIFDSFNLLEPADIRRVFSALLPYLDNSLKYVILHDTILFTRDLDKYALVYKTLYPDTFEKDSSEVCDVFETVYYYSISEESLDELKNRCIKILQKYSSRRVIDGETILQESFDAATSIRLYSKVIDWDWTYNEFIRDILYPELKKSDRPFSVFVLSFIYAEWNKSLSSHKSLEYLIQLLDKIAGIGTGENIIKSMHSLDSQLASALMLRQFRPGASIKWHKKRVEEATPSEKEVIEKAWKISFF
ncbi:hypothetical protein NEMIN01_2054 [Nematocida minor]|uniref:uncharacterized protein n=1 Tax=Nematocida minor TaxID=1912983 RepID=UPI00221FC586|nr:uncharacterized protein NEMIN01_2054 [Nematocida minor]KAI5192503.1 hypothetical protein NEMIN01_2054 [Nematocida minor]